MKQALIFLSVATFILFTSCEKDEEPAITLEQDLQNGYWKATYASNVRKFDESNNYTIYELCETEGCSPNFPCIKFSDTFDYFVDENILYVYFNGNAAGPTASTIRIDGNILTINEDYTLERMSTLDYPDCN